MSFPVTDMSVLSSVKISTQRAVFMSSIIFDKIVSETDCCNSFAMVRDRYDAFWATLKFLTLSQSCFSNNCNNEVYFSMAMFSFASQYTVLIAEQTAEPWKETCLAIDCSSLLFSVLASTDNLRSSYHCVFVMLTS